MTNVTERVRFTERAGFCCTDENKRRRRGEGRGRCNCAGTGKKRHGESSCWKAESASINYSVF